MITHRAYKYRVYPTKEQEARLIRWESALRFLWNLAHEQRLLGLARPKGERKYYSAFDQMLDLKELCKNAPWLADVPRGVCTQLLQFLDKAWRSCFNRLARTPRWKRKGQDIISIWEPGSQRWRLNGSTLRFPKLGNLRVVQHRPLEGRRTSCILKKDGDQWFAIINCEVTIPDPIQQAEPVVGLDRGVVAVVADSDGNVIQNPRFFERSKERLARLQRNVSRKRKGSSNQKKAQLMVMRLHRRVRRQREWLLHQVSSRYSKSHGVVVIEDLRVNNMVHTNHGLSRSIFDSGWSMLESQLSYKLKEAGGTIVKVNPAYTSQTCSACGCVDPLSRVSQSLFRCTSCGFECNADVNAAINIKGRWRPSAQPVEGSRQRAPLRSRKPSKGNLQGSSANAE